MIAAVTGGSGFIGRHLVNRLLNQGNTVRVLARKRWTGFPSEVTIYRGDLADPNDDLTEFVDGSDVLFHCAAEARDCAAMTDTNVHGTKRLIQAVRGRIGHWVQLSSVGVYGHLDAGTICEHTGLQPSGDYESTKALSDYLVSEAVRQEYFSAAILRPSIVYGQDMPNKSLFSMIKMIDAGLFFFVGPLGASANYIHVDNVTHGLLLCGRQVKDRLSIYNLSDHSSIEQVVATIAESLGKPVPRIRMPAGPLKAAVGVLSKAWPACPLTRSRVRALSNRCSYPIERIRADLAYEHLVTMEEGFRGLVRAWKLQTR